MAAGSRLARLVGVAVAVSNPLGRLVAPVVGRAAAEDPIEDDRHDAARKARMPIRTSNEASVRSVTARYAPAATSTDGNT